jgi:hypothetical protein
MQRACGKLGIRLLYARPFSPEGKGKQERYNQTVDSFLREVQLVKPKSLDELNRLYQVWMDECYLHKEHSALDGKSPYEAYWSDRHELRILSSDAIADAFLACETRRVDKSGCISFMGQKYEVELGLHMIHKEVEVVYDAADISKVTIECKGMPTCTARPLIIGSHSGERPRLPEHLEAVPAKESRLLRAAEQKNTARQAIRKTAISYTDLKPDIASGGDGNV